VHAPDDARHSVLARARTGTQARLDPSGGTWVHDPPADPATYEVLEVEAKTALTDFGLGSGYSLNPYMGCSHACLYCYVPDVARVERPRWGTYVIAKRNLPTLLARELRRRPRDDVFLSSATDPYQPAEGRHHITRACLELLARADWPLRVLTRSPLVTRDTEILRAFTDIDVGMSVPTLDDEARRVLEPHAPNIPGRLAALRRLADAGLRTHVSFAPAYPFTGGVTPEYVAEAFRDAGVHTVVAGPWRYLESLRDPLAARLRGTALEPMTTLVERPGYQRLLFRRLGVALERAGVGFEVYDMRDTVKRRLARAAS
jgi:DNA repair photolyase